MVIERSHSGPEPSSLGGSSAFLAQSPSDQGSSYALNGQKWAGYRDASGEKYYDDPDAARTAAVAAAAASTGAYGSGRGLDRRNRKWWIMAAVTAGIALLVIIIVVPVYFRLNKNGVGSSSPDHGAPSSGSNAPGPQATYATMGGDGSQVLLADGSSFTYKNPFGGYWASDPYDNSARPNSWTPPLNATWDWSSNRIFGVNLGGWFVPEPFIAPSLFEPFENDTNPAVDEYTLALKLGNNYPTVMEHHYDTFITEEDFAKIAGAGLNWVRIPIPFWAVSTWPGEPFLEHVSWKYIVRAFTWARKYGIRVNLDLHAVPGSQNGWNHSGKLGIINWLAGPLGYANAQRTLDYLRIITEFISQPAWRDVVQVFGIVNEAYVPTIGQTNVQAFYLEAYETIRNVTGVGSGNGPYISIHDGFIGQRSWAGFMTGADRMTLDTHPYVCFDQQNNDPWPTQWLKPCNTWAGWMNSSMNAFGTGFAGEFSNAINDCGEYVNGVGLGNRYEGTYTGYQGKAVGSCAQFDNWQNWSSDMKNGVKTFAMTSMDALHNWFFWTWKIGNSTKTSASVNPFWSYSLGLENGWMPTDPRQAIGQCDVQAAAQGTSVASVAWDGSYSTWQTGGAGAGTLVASQSASLAANWPPQSLSSAGVPVVQLPYLTRGGELYTLPPSTPSMTVQGQPSPTVTDKGWLDTSDTASTFVTINGCPYPTTSVYSPTVQLPWSCNTAAAGPKKRTPAAALAPAAPPSVRRDLRLARDDA